MKRNTVNQYFLDVRDILKMNKDCHVFLIDKNHRLLAANDKQVQLVQKITGMKSNDELIGYDVDNLFPAQAAKVLRQENSSVIKSKCAKLFYNIWKVDNYKKIILLTMKTPLYNAKKQIIGILGMSVYLAEYSLESTQNVELSARESECLNYLLRGKTSKEIASITHLSVRTIEGYLSKVKTKLNCYSKSKLISKAFKLGIVNMNKTESVISKDFIPGIFMESE